MLIWSSILILYLNKKVFILKSYKITENETIIKLST